MLNPDKGLDRLTGRLNRSSALRFFRDCALKKWPPMGQLKIEG